MKYANTKLINTDETFVKVITTLSCFSWLGRLVCSITLKLQVKICKTFYRVDFGAEAKCYVLFIGVHESGRGHYPPQVWVFEKKLATIWADCIHVTTLLQSNLSVINFVVTRCQIFRVKCTKFNSVAGPPQTPLRELTALPKPCSRPFGS